MVEISIIFFVTADRAEMVMKLSSACPSKTPP
jgi:hypothetical protein